MTQPLTLPTPSRPLRACSCNVCKMQYQFERLSRWRRLSIRLMIPLWPILGMLVLAFALGFIPMFGSAGSDVGLHLLNGLAAVGLLYLIVIVTVFNVQFCRLTIVAARSAAAAIGMAALPTSLQVQLFGYVIARCLLVGLFFGETHLMCSCGCFFVCEVCLQMQWKFFSLISFRFATCMKTFICAYAHLLV